MYLEENSIELPLLVQIKQTKLFSDHNFMFTKLTSLINMLKLQKEKVQNKQLEEYVSNNTRADFIIKDLQALQQSHPAAKMSLFQICFKMTGKYFFLHLTLEIAKNGLSVISIQILSYVTENLGNYHSDAKNVITYGLILMLLVLLLESYCAIKSRWYATLWCCHFQTTVQYLLIDKSLKTKIFTSSSGELAQKDEQNNADINNLITVDIDQALTFIFAIVQGVVAVSMIVFVLILLYQQIGSVVYSGLWIIAASLIFNLIFCVVTMLFFEKFMKVKDKRISLSSDIIEGMKSLKYLNWEGIFYKKIMNIRRSEYNYIKLFRALIGVLFVFWGNISKLLLYTYIIKYTESMHMTLRESGANIYVMISIFSMLEFPLGILPWTILDYIESKTSYDRINKYLNEGDIEEIFSHNEQADGESFYESGVGILQHQVVDSGSFYESEVGSSENLVIKLQNQLFKYPVRQQGMRCTNAQPKISDFTLHIEELKIFKGTLNFVIGKLGSGKSALLQVLLNEMDQVRGQGLAQSQFSMSDDNNVKLRSIEKCRALIRGTLAYVSQNHWLQNKSIRQNICFGLEYNQAWYHEVVTACQLLPDFEAFTNKDLKLVGQGGNNLSGGQKQRVSLARALYQDRDIYLLDDIFSSLDAHVVEQIYTQVVIKKLIERKKTVILVTSHYTHIQKSGMQSTQHNIIYLKNGQIVSDGSEIETYLLQSISLQLEKQKSIQQRQQNSLQPELNDIKLSKSIIRQDCERQTGYEIDEVEQTANEEYRDQGSISWETINSYLKACKYILIISYIFFVFLYSGSNNFIDFWLNSEVSPLKDQNSIFSWVDNNFASFNDTFLYLFLLGFGINVAAQGLFLITCLKSAHTLFNKLNKSIIFSNMKFFDSNPCGRIISRLSHDVLMIDDQIPFVLSNVIEYLGVSVVFPIGIIILFPWISLLIVMVLYLMYLVFQQFRSGNREIKRLVGVNSGQVLSLLSEVCKGLHIIRSFNKQTQIINEYVSRMKDNMSSSVLAGSIFIWLSARLLLIQTLIFIGISVSIVVILETGLDFKLHDLSLCLTYSILVSSFFMSLVMDLSELESLFVSVERVRQYTDLQIEDLDNVVKLNPPQLCTPEELAELKDYSIVFKNVDFSYDDSNNVLKNINLKIKKGSKVAICGRTGSGKTSILNILFRLYEIKKGALYINSKEIRSYSLSELRGGMNIIPQFGFLYNASLKDNLDPSKTYSKQQVQAIIDDSRLNLEGKGDVNNSSAIAASIGRTIDSARMNVDFEIEQSGQNLSNGEKQIINFLRVIIRNQEIICLDEATSNMDPNTDQLLHDKLFEFTEGKTLIVITHRLENIHKYDKIVVMEDGLIVEEGNYNDLKKISNGFFQNL